MLTLRLLSVTSLVLLAGCSQVASKSEALGEPVVANKIVEAKEKILSWGIKETYARHKETPDWIRLVKPG